MIFSSEPYKGFRDGAVMAPFHRVQDSFSRKEVQRLFDLGLEGHGGVRPDEGVDVDVVVFGDGPVVLAHLNLVGGRP